MNQAGTGAGKWIDWPFDGLAVLFFCATLYLIWKNARNIKDARAGNTAVAALLAVFCALMGNPDRFQTFKFSFTGIETSARQAIQQVQVSLQQLQKLATALAEGSLNELALTGTAGAGMSTAEKFRVRDQIVERLRDIGVTQEDIMKAQHLWIVVYCSILEQQILYDAFLGKSLPNTDPITELKNAGIQ